MLRLRNDSSIIGWSFYRFDANAILNLRGRMQDDDIASRQSAGDLRLNIARCPDLDFAEFGMTVVADSIDVP